MMGKNVNSFLDKCKVQVNIQIGTARLTNSECHNYTFWEFLVVVSHTN